MMGRKNLSRKKESSYSSNSRGVKPVFKGKTNSRFAFSIAIATASAGLLFNQSSFAQSMSPVERLTQGLSERVEFDVNRFEVVGDNPISAAETREILAPFIGKSRGIDDIGDAANALENLMLDKGLSFYRVSFPPQELTDGVVDLKVTRFRIGKVNVTGNKHYSNRNISSSLPVLKNGTSPTSKGIARGIRVANQTAGKRVRVSLAAGEGPNEVDANIVVKDQNPLVLTTWLNNTGSDSSGDFRVGASIAHRNIFGLDHNGSLTFITSPEGVDDVQQIAASYRIPLYSIGGSINFVAVNSEVDTGVVADVFDVAGRGDVYGVGYSHVFSTIGSYNHGLSFQAQDKLFDNDVTFQGAQVLEDVRSRPLSAAYQGSWSDGDGGTWSGSLTATTNLGGGSFNNARSYDVSRSGATDDWAKLGLGLSYQRRVNEWLYTVGFSAAITSDRLITGEQFSIGGSGSIRGLEERELRGDEGYQVNLQAWAPPIFWGIRPIAFVDYGYVSNNSPIDGEVSSADAASLGLLLNWNPSSHLSASASYGVLIEGVDSSETTGDTADSGDGKLHFNLTYRF
jgi:hemolysin activation/secretion protein